MITQPTFWDSPEPKPLRAHARRTDPETSHQAADSLEPDALRASQQAVLQCLSGMLGGSGGTDEDIGRVYVLHRSTLYWPIQSVSGLRTRRCELVALGKVRDSGRRKVLGSGRMSIVWEVV